jgi:hypothetical protein
VKLDVLIKKALRSAQPAEAERIKRALKEGRIHEAKRYFTLVCNHHVFGR